jgi:hypothetical protein
MKNKNQTEVIFLTALNNSSKFQTSKGKGSKKVDEKVKKQNEEN